MAYYGYWGKNFVENAGALDMVGAASEVVMPVGRPVDIKRIILVTNTAVDADVVLTIGKRNVDDTASETHSEYTFTSADSGALNDVSAILVAVPDETATVAVDGLDVHTADPELLFVDPGEEFFITGDGGATTGEVQVFVQYQEQGNTGSRFDPVELVRV